MAKFEVARKNEVINKGDKITLYGTRTTRFLLEFNHEAPINHLKQKRRRYIR